MREGTIRAFVGIPITPPAPLRQALEHLSQLRERDGALRPVDEAALHLTLRFLRNIDAALVPRVAAAVDDCVLGLPPLTAQLRGVGAFPSVRQPTVVWAGIAGAEGLGLAVERLNERLLALGLPPPDRADWKPHLTLARVKAKPPPELRLWLEEHRTADLGDCPLHEVHLLESELLPTGPRYTVLHRALPQRTSQPQHPPVAPSVRPDQITPVEAFRPPRSG